MKNNIAIFFALMCLARPQAQAAGTGAEPFNFLFLDANARAVGLAGNYTALASDVNSLHYNPAGLARISRHQATFMHNQYFQDVTQEYLAYVTPQGWGASLNYLNFGNVPNTTISNHAGAGLGETQLTDMAVSFGYGHAFTDNLSLGVGAKYISEVIDDAAGQAFAADLGALYTTRFLHGLTLGLSIQNMGPAVKFQSEKENLPLSIRFGGAYHFKLAKKDSLLAADLTKTRNDDIIAGLGFETQLVKALPIRVGYSTRNDDGLGITAGLGYLYNNLSFDYAFATYKELGSTHRISLTYSWGEAKK